MVAKPSFFLEEMTATPWMTWFSLPAFCALCNCVHFIASLQCHCAIMARELSRWLRGSRALSAEGLWAGEPWRRASSLLEMDWNDWWAGNGCHQQENWPRRALARGVLNSSLLPSLKLCRTVSPPSEGLMLEVLCRGEFSTSPDIKFFVLSGAIPQSRTVKVLQCSGCSRDGGMGVWTPVNALLGCWWDHVSCVVLCHSCFWMGSVDVSIQRLGWGEGWVLAQQLLSTVWFTPLEF